MTTMVAMAAERRQSEPAFKQKRNDGSDCRACGMLYGKRIVVGDDRTKYGSPTPLSGSKSSLVTVINEYSKRTTVQRTRRSNTITQSKTGR